MIVFFFFFQAEDGIRDHCVTGVQTCALPILDVADRRGRDVVGMLSKPKTRVTSSTRSASPTMSGRHGGTAAVHGPLPSTVKPSLARIAAVLSDGTSIAV